MTTIRTALIDGYLDEPSCLGVPPYVSPHVRYLYGALIDGGIRREDISYFTADGLREEIDFRNGEAKKETALEEFDLVLVMAGTTVPGNYLRGRPLSLAEINDLGQNVFYPTLVLCGPLNMVLASLPGSEEIRSGFDITAGEISAADIYLRLCRRENKRGNIDPEKLESDINAGGGQYITRALARWSQTGAEIFSRHPQHPRLVAELETFRGCPRARHCKFCSEQLKQISYQRPPGDISDEVKAIANREIHNFRLGCQTDLLAYHGNLSCDIDSTEGIIEEENEVLGSGRTNNFSSQGFNRADSEGEPSHSCQKKTDFNLKALEKLYSGIRMADPELNVLHLDNINPGPVARSPDWGRKALQIITDHNTPGDVAALGLESADPEVLAANNIDTDVELTYKAIKIINEIGGQREAGIPQLLPGLNFLFGLKGERQETYQHNMNFLQKIKGEGLLLRRINVRQVNPLGRYASREVDYNKFKKFKQRVNEEINRPMLKEVFPRGTVLTGLWPEKQKGHLTYARQPASYPILVGIPGDHMDKNVMQAQVIDYGYRSITALAYPFYVNEATRTELEHIPGIGGRRAGRIVAEKPRNRKELKKLLGPSFPWQQWQNIFRFSS